MSHIAQFITGESIATTVHMVRKAQTTPRPVMLVEGDKDRRVLRTTLRDYADVIPGHGKATTLDALNYIDLAAVSGWLILIVDADFDRVLKVEHPPLVLLTDLHDMDCEHVRSPALNKVVQEICSEQKCRKAFKLNLKDNLDELTDAVRGALVSMAMPIGLLRLVSIEHDFRLAFKRIDHSKVLDPESPVLSKSKLISAALAAGAKPGVTATQLRAELSKAENSGYDPWQICQGHDLNKLFVVAVRKFWGVGKLSVEEVERSMRLAYETTFFWQTSLGKAVASRLKSMGLSIEKP